MDLILDLFLPVKMERLLTFSCLLWISLYLDNKFNTIYFFMDFKYKLFQLWEMQDHLSNYKLLHHQ